jgi:hypothetical protein
MSLLIMKAANSALPARIAYKTFWQKSSSEKNGLFDFKQRPIFGLFAMSVYHRQTRQTDRQMTDGIE